MTGVSEQGKAGLLWTIFEGEPFCSRRIASFANEREAKEYLLWKQGNFGTIQDYATIARLESELKTERDLVKGLDGDITNLHTRNALLEKIAKDAKRACKMEPVEDDGGEGLYPVVDYYVCNQCGERNDTPEQGKHKADCVVIALTALDQAKKGGGE